jgi:hypothetical protein
VTDRAYEQLQSGIKATCAGRVTAAGTLGFDPSNGGWPRGCGLGGLGRSPAPGQQFGEARA